VKRAEHARREEERIGNFTEDGPSGMMALMKKAQLVILLGLITMYSAPGQTFKTLHTFGDITRQTGMRPKAPLVHGGDGTLYGTTSEGAGGGGVMHGAIFKVRADGAGFGLIKQFTNKLDGAEPGGALLFNSNVLYGITTAGGLFDGGTAFRVDTDGTGFRVLTAFPNGSYDSDRSTNRLNTWGVGTKPPVGGLTLWGTNLFGVTRAGGEKALGTIFKVGIDGDGYAALKEFSGPDGAAPFGDLVLSGSTLFGTTSFGGDNNMGTVFRMNTDGTGFAVLKHFAGSVADDGAIPVGGLLLNGSTLFGTTTSGGLGYGGTVFRLNTDGADFQILNRFANDDPLGIAPVGRLLLYGEDLYGVTSTFGSALNSLPGVFRVHTNRVGANRVMPWFGQLTCGVILINETLYGTAYSTTANPYGNVYAVNVNGSETRVLHGFTGQTGGPSRPNPLLLSDGFLYGTTVMGEASNFGTVFRIHTNGTGYTVLKEFTGGTNGANPRSRLTISGDTLYGVTSGDVGLMFNSGTVYRLKTNGSGFEVLHRFGLVLDDGYRPYGSPVFVNGVLYGTTLNGGRSSNGSIYRMNPDGTDYRVLKSFFNPDGLHPIELTVVDDALYGSCFFGGFSSATGQGTIFKITPDGSFTVLHNFTEMYPPVGRLTAVGGTLYGAGFSRSAFRERGALDPLDEGRIMKINTDGSGFAILTQLTGNLRGDVSASGLIQAGDMLIGLTRGQPGEVVDPPDTLLISRNSVPKTQASIFQMSISGTGVASIYQLDSASEGIWLNGDLVLDGATLYGTAYAGGEAGEGTIFKLDLRPRLQITPSASGLKLSWASYANSASLEQTTKLSPAEWTTISSSYSTNSEYISVNVGVSNSARFFRLR
jgi:uncharacterized repeat protein (TIGR03803 family)